MTTLSNGTVTITPELVTGYETMRTARTIAHDVIGRPDPDVTLRAAGTRKGRLELLFVDEASANQAAQLHAAASVWTLADPDLSTIGMLYVVAAGDITSSLEDQSRELWLVSVPYLEVLP